MAGDNCSELVNFKILDKSLDIFKVFNSDMKDKPFFFNINIKDTFKLTVNYGDSKDTIDDKIKKTVKKTYKSPSTKRRNAKRLAIYKAKKAGNKDTNKVINSDTELYVEDTTISDNQTNTNSDKTGDEPTHLDASRRVDVPLEVVVDVHPPPKTPPSQPKRRTSARKKGPTAQPEILRSSSDCLGEEAIYSGRMDPDSAPKVLPLLSPRSYSFLNLQPPGTFVPNGQPAGRFS